MTTRNGSLLASIGEAMFGDHWMQPLGEALRVHKRTIRRWRDGDYPIPDGIWAELRELCWKRSTALETLARLLPRE